MNKISFVVAQLHLTVTHKKDIGCQLKFEQ